MRAHFSGFKILSCIRGGGGEAGGGGGSGGEEMERIGLITCAAFQNL